MMLLIFNLLLVVLLMIAACLYARKRIQQHTARLFKIRSLNGIEKLETIEVNGVNQCLQIRGQDKSNPVLLFIHGGPGMTHIGWYEGLQRPWEDFFTVVQWDQRQAGKSYGSVAKLGDSLSNQQMLADAEVVVDYLRQSLSKEKIFVMGWSYGSYLGIKLAKSRPDWLYAYIGVSQSVNVTESIRVEHAKLLDYDTQQKDRALENQLKAMMPRPAPGNKMASFLEHSYFITSTLFNIGKFDLSPEDYESITRFGYLTSPHYSLRDLFNLYFGDPCPAFTLPETNFGREFMDIDLPAEVGITFSVPIVFLSSLQDWHVPFDLTDQWFKQIEAPYKKQVIFEDSFHVPAFTVPGKFLCALVDSALPLANQSEQLEVHESLATES